MNMTIAVVDKFTRMALDAWFNFMSMLTLFKYANYKGTELEALLEITGWPTKNYGINLVTEFIDELDSDIAELDGYPEWTKIELRNQREHNCYLLRVLKGEVE